MGQARRLLLVMTTVYLSACTSLDHEYIDEEFDGIDTSMREAVAEGGALHLLVIHGMGPNEPGYSHGLVRGLRLRMGMIHDTSWKRWEPLEIRYPRAVPLPPLADSAAEERVSRLGSVHYDRYHDEDGRVLIVHELTWSPATHAIRKHYVGYDSLEDPLRRPRTSFGATIKHDLMNSAFPDAVLYVGRYAPVLQYVVAQCLHGLVARVDPERDRIAAITMSLGSAMFLETLEAMTAEAADPEMPPTYDGSRFLGTPIVAGAERDEFHRRVERLGRHPARIFFLANQLHLVDMGRADGLRFDPWTPTEAPADGKRPHWDLHVTAFNDPNDLLGYPIRDEWVGVPIHRGFLRMHFRNVNINIARTSFAGLLNFKTAHVGHASSNRVMQLLVEGWRKPIDVDQ